MNGQVESIIPRPRLAEDTSSICLRKVLCSCVLIMLSEFCLHFLLTYIGIGKGGERGE